MKKRIFLVVLCLVLSLFSGCAPKKEAAQIAATTLPVFCFTSEIVKGSDIAVTQLVNQQISCLHDYTMQVSQMQIIERAQVVVLSGAGLEAFLGDALQGKTSVIDASQGVMLHCGHHHHHDEDTHHEGHAHDPHIWLSPANAAVMARNICQGLTQYYPEHRDLFTRNLNGLLQQLQQLQDYGEQTLGELSCRDLITFHDGFHYFAESFDLHILKAFEEEAGSETSAADLISLISLVQEHSLPAVFTERNGSRASADVVASETGAKVYALDMAMSGNSYFDSMYHNINTIKEALG